MSLKSKFISFLTVGAGVVVFSATGFAQDDKATTTTTVAPDKAERPFKRNHDRGDRKFEGREGREGRHGDHDRKRGGREMFRGLNLTEDQKAQFKALRESNRPDAATIAELKAIRESRKAGTELTPEQKDRVKFLRERGKLKAKAAHEQMLNILTAEQKAQLEARKAEMKQHMQERRQQWEQRKQNRTPNAPAITDKPKDN